MFSASVKPAWDLNAWRDRARAGLRAEISPESIDWNADAQTGMAFGDSLDAQAPLHEAPSVPAAFVLLAQAVLCHRDPQRHALLYRILWRITHGERRLLEQVTDIDVHRANALEQAIRRDAHKMKAFVRFREVPGESESFIAWFEPDHFIVDRVAPFFARRFTGMRWAILTPYRSATWDGQSLAFSDGAQRSDAPAEDAREDLWRTYYANIFNPGRLNPRMMTQEMPQKYWKHLPEAELLPDLIRDAGARVRNMAEREAQAPRRRIPHIVDSKPQLADTDLDSLRLAAKTCHACPLWEPATQTVFGEGPADARVMLIGEQPGDQEDLKGRPFVGPAGQLLDRALKELNVDRKTLYLTNAVKHFRFERRGKMRLHKNPEAMHIAACRRWLAGEIADVRPEIIVVLGATAALAVFGRQFKLMRDRGTWHNLEDGTHAFATVHPAWVLRQREGQESKDGYQMFVNDLALMIEKRPQRVSRDDKQV